VLGNVDGLDILEFGCGAAQWSRALADLGGRPVGLDQSQVQLGFADRGLALVCASGEAVPLRDASFDIVFCDHGAMSFCDPDATVPEVARVLRPNGLLVFNASTLLRNLCFPADDPDAQITRKLHSPYFDARLFDWGDGTIDFQIPHGEWIALFHANGMTVESLIELRPPVDATTTFPDYANLEWARQWPAEEIWRVRKRS